MVYLCRTRNFSAKEDRQTFEDILLRAKSRNGQSGVTGALVGHAGMLLQVLEGDRATVLSAYQQTLNDPGHHTCYLIWRGPVTSRQFAVWGTYAHFVDAPGASADKLSAFFELLQLGPTISAPEGKRLTGSQSGKSAPSRAVWEDDSDIIYL